LLPHLSFSVEYANLVTIDLAKAATAEGRVELVVQVQEALATHGFFYAINHGYTKVQVFRVFVYQIKYFAYFMKADRIFDIANVAFADVGSEEKDLYTGNTEVVGGYQGYKPRQTWV